jgi:hypothetical protein
MNRRPVPQSRKLAVAELSAESRAALRGDYRPAGEAGQLAAAIVACAAGDLAAAEAALAGAGAGELAGRWRARLDVLRMGQADADAKLAWNELLALPTARPGAVLTEETAKGLLQRIGLFERLHGRTDFAGSVAGELAALRERARSVLGRRVAVPAGAVQVLVAGGAAAAPSPDGQTLGVTVPPRGKAMVPLAVNTRDFALCFEYRGPGVEMFLRRDGARWRGCVLALLTEKLARVRYYPQDDQNRPQDVTAAQAGLDAADWHRVEASMRGGALRLAVDGREVAAERDLPALTRGDSYILIWDTRGGAVELRGLEIAVAEKDTATSAGGGIVEGIAAGRDRDGRSIQVRNDGGGGVDTYLPLEMGGAAHPGTVEAIKNIISANRVTVIWKPRGGQRCIAAIWPQLPAQKAGTVTGTVVGTGSAFDGRLPQFDLKPDDGGPLERYSPRWQNGPDPEIAAAIRALKAGDRVRVEWFFEGRKRAVKIQRVQ